MPAPAPLLGRWAAVATGIAAVGVLAAGVVSQVMLGAVAQAHLLPR